MGNSKRNKRKKREDRLLPRSAGTSGLVTVRLEDGACVGVERAGEPIPYNLFEIRDGQEVPDEDGIEPKDYEGKLPEIAPQIMPNVVSENRPLHDSLKAQLTTLVALVGVNVLVNLLAEICEESSEHRHDAWRRAVTLLETMPDLPV